MADVTTQVIVPGNRITLLDIVKANGSDGIVGLVEEAQKATPEVMMGAAPALEGLNYKTLIRKSVPIIGFRDANTGSSVVKSVYENRLVDTYIMNPRIEADKKVADDYEDGAESYLAIEATGVMEGAFQTLGRCFYYGRRNNTLYGGDAKGFPGLLDMIDPYLTVDAGGATFTATGNVTSGSNIITTLSSVTGLAPGVGITGTGIPAGTTIIQVNAGTSTIVISNNATASNNTVTLTISAGTSVWFVIFGQQNVQWVFGNDGQMAMAPTRVGDIITPDGGHVTGYISELLAQPGLQVLNRFSVVRIKNITTQAGHTLNDNLLGSALALLPAAYRGRMKTQGTVLMNTRSLEQLRSSRTAINPTGAPAPTPQDFEGIPIEPSDSIAVAEGADIA